MLTYIFISRPPLLFLHYFLVISIAFSSSRLVAAYHIFCLVYAKYFYVRVIGISIGKKVGFQLLQLVFLRAIY